MAGSPAVANAGFVRTLRSAGDPLRDRNFRIYWISNGVFFIGQGLVLLGAQWLMLTLTDSRVTLGLIGAIQATVVITLSPLAGVMADRMARRSLLIFSRVGFALVMAVMGTLVFAGEAEVWHILVSVAVSGCFFAISQPATQTYVFDLVGPERLMNAIALNTIGTGVFQILGPSVGGGLVDAIGPEGTYFAGGAGYALGAVALLAIPVPGKTAAASAPKSFARDLTDGVRYLRRDPLLRWIFLAASGTFFCGAMLALRPVFARDILDVGASGLGWLGAAFGLGNLVGSLLILGLGDRLKLKGLAMILPPLSWVTCMAIYSQSQWFPLNLWLEFQMGLSPPVWLTAVMTILQIRVPEQFRSRVIAVHFMILQSVQLNWIVAGYTADALGDRTALLIMGLIPAVVLTAMLIFLKPVVFLGSARYPLVPFDGRARGAVAAANAP